MPDRSQWVQLTKFPDSVTQPALSPDGRMVAFIRGYSTFLGPGQIYVKILPDGQPVQSNTDLGLFGMIGDHFLPRLFPYCSRGVTTRKHGLVEEEVAAFAGGDYATSD